MKPYQEDIFTKSNHIERYQKVQIRNWRGSHAAGRCACGEWAAHHVQPRDALGAVAAPVLRRRRRGVRESTGWSGRRGSLRDVVTKAEPREFSVVGAQLT